MYTTEQRRENLAKAREAKLAKQAMPIQAEVQEPRRPTLSPRHVVGVGDVVEMGGATFRVAVINGAVSERGSRVVLERIS